MAPLALAPAASVTTIAGLILAGDLDEPSERQVLLGGGVAQFVFTGRERRREIAGIVLRRRHKYDELAFALARTLADDGDEIARVVWSLTTL
jgi:hypothetical protein